ALAVELGWIVGCEEDVEDVAIAHLVGVEGHPDRLGMAGVAAADLLVGRVGDMAADIAALDLADADNVLEHRLGAPEAPAGQRCLLFRHFYLLVQVRDRAVQARGKSGRHWRTAPISAQGSAFCRAMRAGTVATV